MTTNASPTASTLLGLLEHVPAEKTAIILPDHAIRVSYGSLRTQVQALAEQLAAAGIEPGDRIGIALPNGLPMIVSFLAASMAGTAAPLNPAYREEEFRFYLDDTNARVLVLPPDITQMLSGADWITECSPSAPAPSFSPASRTGCTRSASAPSACQQWPIQRRRRSHGR